MIEIKKLDLSKLNVIGNVQRSKTNKFKDEIKSLKDEIKRLKDEKEVAEGNYFYTKGILDKLKEKVKKDNYPGYNSVNHNDVYIIERIQKLENSNKLYKLDNRRLVTENEALREQVWMMSNGNDNTELSNDDRSIAEKFLDGWIDSEGD